VVRRAVVTFWWEGGKSVGLVLRGVERVRG